jgi:plasmid maintenance system antidote protein VapI
MNKTRNFALPGEYDPGKLLSAVMEQKGLNSLSKLAKLLEVESPTLSNIKLRKLPLSQKLLNRIQKVSGMSIREMRDLMDDRRREIRMAEMSESD